MGRDSSSGPHLSECASETVTVTETLHVTGDQIFDNLQVKVITSSTRQSTQHNTLPPPVQTGLKGQSTRAGVNNLSLIGAVVWPQTHSTGQLNWISATHSQEEEDLIRYQLLSCTDRSTLTSSQIIAHNDWLQHKHPSFIKRTESWLQIHNKYRASSCWNVRMCQRFSSFILHHVFSLHPSQLTSRWTEAPVWTLQSAPVLLCSILALLSSPSGEPTGTEGDPRG